MSAPPIGGLVVVNDDGVPSVNGVPLGAEAARQLTAGDAPGQPDAMRAVAAIEQQEEGQPMRVPGLTAVQEWLRGEQDASAFRASVGVGRPLTPMQRHLAQAQAADAAEARAEARRFEQAEANRVGDLQRMLAESGASSVAELSSRRAVQRMVIERREDREWEQAQAERRERAQEANARMLAAGHRPRTLDEILQAQMMFP